MVIGAVESNQANNKAADELEDALSVKAKEPAASLTGFWRNLRALVGTRGTRTAFRITNAENLESTTNSTPVRSSRATPHVVPALPDFRPFL